MQFTSSIVATIFAYLPQVIVEMLAQRAEVDHVMEVSCPSGFPTHVPQLAFPATNLSHSVKLLCKVVEMLDNVA